MGSVSTTKRTRPLRVCAVAYTFYESDNRVRRYAETLAKRGDDVEAIVLRRPGQPEFELLEGVRVYRIQERVRDERNPLHYLRRLLLFFVRSAWMLTHRHIRACYDIIHVHSVPDFQVFATIVPRIMGARVILDIHDIVPEFYASKFGVSERSLAFRILLLAEKLSACYSNHVIVSNHLWHAKLVRRSIKPEKCTTILNYPDTSIFSRHSNGNQRNGNFVMCYPGSLNWHQGVDVAIRAVDLLRDRAPMLRFLVIGDGPDRDKLKRQIAERHLDDRVRMAGVMPIEKVAETIAAADLGVVPKRNDSFGGEAFSTKILEFMAMGVPVVASNTRIDQHYFSDNLVQFFESGNAEDLAEKILSLISNPERRGALRLRATEFIESNNWDIKKREYLDLLDHLLRPAKI
jgi:glycosyltransferase involved in cell wall biosynthesis